MKLPRKLSLGLKKYKSNIYFNKREPNIQAISGGFHVNVKFNLVGNYFSVSSTLQVMPVYQIPSFIQPAYRMLSHCTYTTQPRSDVESSDTL